MKASSGIEMMVRLDRAARPSLRVQLERQLRESVRSGALRRDAPLPSSRALARELGVARGIVTEAYAQLAAEGYLVSRQGAPTRVATAAVPDAPPPRAEAVREPRYDFQPGSPDPALFPRDAWAGAVRQALREAPDARFGYGDPRGVPELRDSLATYLGRVRGVVAEPETIIVTSGVTQGLTVACRSLVAAGVRQLAIEDPGSVFMRAPLTALGLQLVPVPVDEHGIDVGALERSGAGAVLVTPAHQYPTGVVLSPERRAALIAWGGWVLEDDYDAEFRYDRPPVGALQGLDQEHVIYLSSISKTLAPALRMGWLVPPPALAEAMRREKAAADRGTPVLEQLGLAVLLERGELDRHVRRSRLAYRRRRDVLVDALARHLPDARPSGAAAGLHLLVELPPGVDEAAVLAAAAAAGIGVEGLAQHRVGPGPAALVMGYSRIPEASIEPGLRRLAELIR